MLHREPPAMAVYIQYIWGCSYVRISDMHGIPDTAYYPINYKMINNDLLDSPFRKIVRPVNQACNYSLDPDFDREIDRRYWQSQIHVFDSILVQHLGNKNIKFMGIASAYTTTTVTEMGVKSRTNPSCHRLARADR